MKSRIKKGRQLRESPGYTVSQRSARILSVPVVCLGTLLLALSPMVFAAASPQPAQTPIVIRGNLDLFPGNQPGLQTGQKSYRLAGQSPYILRTLQDKRLLHQELQLVGTMGTNGDFVVQRLYAVHNGKLYKIQYYCEVCNITYVQPGHCACCGRETKLQEVPVGEGE